MAKRAWFRLTAFLVGFFVLFRETSHEGPKHDGPSFVPWVPGAPLHIEVELAEGPDQAVISTQQLPPPAPQMPPQQHWAFDDDDDDEVEDDWADWPGMHYVAGVPASLLAA